ncbi:MAG: PIN domain-containing protein [Candidatus Methanoperedens sp.]|nr:PIN domain-containing protein [Candidatus Methanoperedens sp.]MCZ7395355.1 PIN domain-containing protein [Candidatus Methanoperedens sp.]
MLYLCEKHRKSGVHIRRIYLDTCAWCRPFDAPSSKRVLEESNAIPEILRRVDAGEFEIIDSSVLLAEISMIAPKLKEEAVLSFVKHVARRHAIVNDAVERLASDIMRACSIGALDALHLAIAIENKAELFITTDDVILNKTRCISKYKITVKNPCEV